MIATLNYIHSRANKRRCSTSCFPSPKPPFPVETHISKFHCFQITPGNRFLSHRLIHSTEFFAERIECKALPALLNSTAANKYYKSYVPIRQVPSKVVHWCGCSRKDARPQEGCPRFERYLHPASCA